MGAVALALAGPVLRPTLVLVDRCWRRATDAVERTATATAAVAQRCAWALLIFAALGAIVCATLVFAIGQYGVLYWLLVPRIHIDKPVYFDFKCVCVRELF